MSDRWWTCSHDGIGLPGCPTCDGRFPGPRELSGARTVIVALGSDTTTRDVLLLDDARGWLREGRDEIARLTAERDALRAAVERVRPVVDGIAVACDKAEVWADATDGVEWPIDYLRDALPDGTWTDKATALRALLADVPEVAP